jgi:hypothetical protein
MNLQATEAGRVKRIPGSARSFELRVDEALQGLDWVDDDDEDQGCYYIVRYVELDAEGRRQAGIETNPGFLIMEIVPQTPSV